VVDLRPTRVSKDVAITVTSAVISANKLLTLASDDIATLSSELHQNGYTETFHSILTHQATQQIKTQIPFSEANLTPEYIQMNGIGERVSVYHPQHVRCAILGNQVDVLHP
jgi:hypothetical protein